MSSLDLTKPGKLWAKVQNESDTTFHVVIPQPKYTPEALSKNPQIEPGHELMKPFTVPYKKRDRDDMASCDLDTSGRAAEIMASLSQKYEAGHPRIEKVRVLYIAKAREGNRIPDAIVARTLDLDLIAIPSILLRPVVDFVTVKNFKGECCACARRGKKEFEVEMTVTGPIDQVKITTTPSSDVRIEGGPSGKGALAAPVREGAKYLIKVKVPLTRRVETQTRWQDRKYVNYVPGGWRTQAGIHFYNATYEREVWDGGNVSLRVAGVGAYAGVVKSLNLRSESWGAAWLERNPPAPLAHNVC